jgi:hypothetical protein
MFLKLNLVVHLHHFWCRLHQHHFYEKMMLFKKKGDGVAHHPPNVTDNARYQILHYQ